jgi:hypothetical protein
MNRLKVDWAEAREESFALVGSLIYAGAITGMVSGISFLPDLRSLWFTVGGILALILFVLWVKKARNPVLNIELFIANRVFAFSSLAALIHYSATFAVTFLLSLYL